MTTIVISRKHKQIAADSFNTDTANMARLVNKIEKMSNDWYFLGSGHLKPLGLLKRWVEATVRGEEPEAPDLEFVECDNTYSFTVAIVSPDMSEIRMIDDELEWYTILDEYTAIGSGSAFALGALDAGATPSVAVACAIKRDIYSGEPLQLLQL
jgi:hypothetical protein